LKDIGVLYDEISIKCIGTDIEDEVEETI